MFCIGSLSSSSVQSENSSAHFVQNKLFRTRWLPGSKGGANNFCLQKSGMPLAGLVYLIGMDHYFRPEFHQNVLHKCPL